MSATNGKIFKNGQFLYAIDVIGKKATIVYGIIKIVDKQNETLTLKLVDGTRRIYHFKDYNHLIFVSNKSAFEKLEKLPKPQSTIFKIYNNTIYKEKVLGIINVMPDNLSDFAILLENKELIPIKEIDVSVFLDKDIVAKHIK